MDKATLDSINTIFDTAFGTAFGKHMSEIEAKINTITQANKESTEKITQKITGLTQTTESITQVTQRVDTMVNNFENKFESMHHRLINLEQGTPTQEEHMKNITKAGTIKHKISEKTDITKSDITRAALKIISISLITNMDFERLNAPNMSIDDLYVRTTVEFLMEELKYTQDECKNLDVLRIT